MCDPISMTGFALSAASAVSGLAAQSAQASAQSAVYEQNKTNATKAFADTNSALNQREEQQQAATGQKLQENALATQSAQATSLAAGAAGGVEGLSLESILGDFGARNDRATGAINTQAGWNLAQDESEKVGAGDQTVSRINSVQPGHFGALNFVDAGLRIASGGLTAENQYQRNQYYGTGGSPLNFLGGS